MEFLKKLNEPDSWGGLGVMLLSVMGLIPSDFSAFGGYVGAHEIQLMLGLIAIGCGAVAVAQKSSGNKLAAKVEDAKGKPDA